MSAPQSGLFGARARVEAQFKSSPFLTRAVYGHDEHEAARSSSFHQSMHTPTSGALDQTVAQRAVAD